jgi:hypothetical protein
MFHHVVLVTDLELVLVFHYSSGPLIDGHGTFGEPKVFFELGIH